MILNYVLENANAPRTGIIQLAGAPLDRMPFFRAYVDGAQLFYFIDDGAQSEWGVGTMHYGAPNTISRDTVIGNTATDQKDPNLPKNKLNFAGAVQVYNEIPGQRLAYINGNVLWAPTAHLDSHAGGVPIGASMDYWGAAAPNGWVFCDGRWLSRTTYALLFSVIGTTYGAADGAGYFAVPDCQGGITYGKNIPAPGGYTNNFRLGPWQNAALGESVGDWRLDNHSHTVTVSENSGQGHSHGLTVLPHTHVLAPTGHLHSYRHTGLGAGPGLAAGGDYNLIDQMITTNDGIGEGIPNFTGTGSSGVAISMGASLAGISVQVASAGTGIGYQNVSPGLICNKILYAGPIP